MADKVKPFSDFVCEICNACLQGTAEVIKERPDDKLYVHHRSSHSFIRAIREHCKFCLRLFTHLTERWLLPASRFKRASTDPEDKIEFLAIFWAREKLEYLRAWVAYDQEEIDGIFELRWHRFTDSANWFERLHGTSCELYGTRGGRLKNTDNRNASPLSVGSTNTASMETTSMISKWLQDCDQHHPECASREVWYPTRLLEIGLGDSFKVVETSIQVPDGEYCTLSHCWGNNQPVLLTQQTKSDLFHGSTIASLPKTFREAARLCRSLGLRYIWIDSLCIMQDSPDDWAREAQMMQKVYTHGLFNISATASKDGSEGLFRDRLPLACSVHEIPEGSHSVLKPGMYQHCDPNFLNVNLEWTPLQQRAWVFQERLLSRRNIHFGPGEVIWECNTLTASESHACAVPQFLTTNSPYVKRQRLKRSTASLYHQSSSLGDWANEQYWQWDAILEKYSSLNITYPDDRATALAGISQSFEQVLSDRCRFGIWERRFEIGLLWELDTSDLATEKPFKETACTNAPSFSPLSTEERISSGQRNEKFKVVQHSLDSETAPPRCTTGCQKPSIDVRGKLFHIQITQLRTGDVVQNAFDFHFADNLRAARCGIVFDRAWEAEKYHLINPQKEGWSTAADECREMKVFCFLASHENFDWEDSHKTAYFLLDPQEGYPGTYRRLALVKFQINNKREELRRHMLFPQGDRSHYPCLSYDSETGDHTIRLV